MEFLTDPKFYGYLLIAIVLVTAGSALVFSLVYYGVKLAILSGRKK